MASFRAIGIAFASALALFSATGEASGASVSRAIDPGAFTAISAHDGLDVSFAPGPAKVVIEGPADEIREILAEVRDGALEISRRTGPIHFRFFSRGVRVHVTGPAALSALKANSGADIVASGVSASALTVSASSGAHIRVMGTCSALTARASSGADIEASQLGCTTAVADAASGADVRIFARQRVDATASSGGDVTVRGPAPIVNRSESSGGDVNVLR